MMHDVVIVGAGPAGTTAAYHLAQAGFDVVLAEKDRLPRHVVCGEFLSPESRAALDSLGVLAGIVEAGARTVRSAVLTEASGGSIVADLPADGIALSRWAMDHLLLQNARRAGVDVREATTARNVEGDLDHGFTVETSEGTIASRVVIGAFGKRSILDRTLERQFFRHVSPFVGLKQHFESATCGDSVELHAFDGGYCGLVEVENGRMNACSLIRVDVLKEIGSTDSFEGMMALNPILKNRLRGVRPVFSKPLAISQVSFSAKDVMERDICMIGDTAGLISPLAGDGMAMALHSGEQAARCAVAFLSGDIDAAEFRLEYRRAWHREFSRRLRIGRALQHGYLRAPIARLGLGILQRSPRLLQWVIRSTRG